MEQRFYMGFITPPIHFGRVILYVWSSPFLSVFYATCTLDGTYAPLCFPQCFAVDTIRSIHHLSQDSRPSLWRGCINTLVTLVLKGLQFHPPGTTAVSTGRITCLLPPPAGGSSRQNLGKIICSIQAVLKVVSAPARFWIRGARCFVVRLCVLEGLVTICSVFGGSMIRDSKTFRSGTGKLFTPYV